MRRIGPESDSQTPINVDRLQDVAYTLGTSLTKTIQCMLRLPHSTTEVLLGIRRETVIRVHDPSRIIDGRHKGSFVTLHKPKG